MWVAPPRVPPTIGSEDTGFGAGLPPPEPPDGGGLGAGWLDGGGLDDWPPELRDGCEVVVPDDGGPPAEPPALDPAELDPAVLGLELPCPGVLGADPAERASAGRAVGADVSGELAGVLVDAGAAAIGSGEPGPVAGEACPESWRGSIGASAPECQEPRSPCAGGTDTSSSALAGRAWSEKFGKVISCVASATAPSAIAPATILRRCGAAVVSSFRWAPPWRLSCEVNASGS